VFYVFATAQAAIATVIVVLGKGAPTAHPPFFDNATFSLFVTVAGTCIASATLGLVLSSIAQSNEQIMQLLAGSIILQLVLAGGMIPVTGRAGLNQLSWITPARWGYAAGASSIDFPSLVKVKQIPTNDPIWQHSKHIYALDMAMLAVLSVFYTAYVRWAIRLKR
jgi:ABC transport system ATP-binding/permease protein